MKNIGLWINDQEAVIVSLQNGREETRKIFSVVEKPIHARTSKRPYLAPAPTESNVEITPDPPPADPQDVYFNGIISLIHDAESIFIFGPGEAKGELNNRLQNASLGASIVGIESVDLMTIPQISDKVISHYRNI